MKKILAILTAGLAAFAANTGCDIDADLSSPLVIGNIKVEPAAWKENHLGNRFDHFYHECEIPELTSEVLEMGFFHTYWNYTEDAADGGQILVQEGEGASRWLEREENGEWIRYQETVSCSYLPGKLRIALSRSDGNNRRPDKTLYFRLVIIR